MDVGILAKMAQFFPCVNLTFDFAAFSTTFVSTK
jgi:hypothetical protein